MVALPQGSIWLKDGGAVFFGFMTAGISSGSFKGAVGGAFSAAAFTSIGGAFDVSLRHDSLTSYF